MIRYGLMALCVLCIIWNVRMQVFREVGGWYIHHLQGKLVGPNLRSGSIGKIFTHLGDWAGWPFRNMCMVRAAFFSVLLAILAVMPDGGGGLGMVQMYWYFTFVMAGNILTMYLFHLVSDIRNVYLINMNGEPRLLKPTLYTLVNLTGCLFWSFGMYQMWLGRIPLMMYLAGVLFLAYSWKVEEEDRGTQMYRGFAYAVRKRARGEVGVMVFVCFLTVFLK